MARKILILFPFLVIGFYSFAYRIEGQINLSDRWQPKVYLASIHSPGNLFVASPEFKINEATVYPDGRFELSGNDLPDDPRFYRLYLVRNSLFALEFSPDSIRNFMHLLLTNSTEVRIDAGSQDLLFDAIRVEGSAVNKILTGFEKTYFQERNALTRINTVAKRDFQSQSMNRSIRDFVNNSDDAMVGLFALYHIEDRETDFLRNSGFYFDFQERLKAQYPKAMYTNAYDDLLNNLVGYRDLVCGIPKITKPWRTWVIWAEAVIILALGFWLYKLKTRKSEDGQINYVDLLTEKERTIWKGLAAGKTNKEIAADLFIELSTVKTHINNLYKRLGVSNRKEAIALYNKRK
jgi:DNA-binding CsgD family transcriptional regulator